MDKMKAKFSCHLVDEDGIAHLSAVTDSDLSDEDNQFAEATPYGELQIMVDNPNAKGLLKEGKEYYLDFTEA